MASVASDNYVAERSLRALPQVVDAVGPVVPPEDVDAVGVRHGHMAVPRARLHSLVRKQRPRPRVEIEPEPPRFQ